jgi:hypothetical protein
MKILSFDVGIKNLAYCIINKLNDDFKIEKWGIINLVDERDICQHVLRNNNICGKIARYKIIVNNEEKVLCNTHQTKYKIDIIQCDKYNCCIDKCKNKSKINILDKEEYSWCEKHEAKSKKILSQYKPKKITKQNCTQQPIQELATKLNSCFDKDKDFLDVSEVLIENQPSLINPTMKTISTLLYQYFVIRGITDKSRTMSKIEYIRFISPSNKLKINKTQTEKSLNDATNKKEEYFITKNLGKIYCEKLISVSEMEILKKYDKKDDMCDAFLQGFQHIFNPIPDKFIKKLDTIDSAILEKAKPKKKKIEKVIEISSNIIDDNVNKVQIIRIGKNNKS